MEQIRFDARQYLHYECRTIHPDVRVLSEHNRCEINFTQAMIEYDEGMHIFEAGVYGAALILLQRADTYFSAALNTWATRGTALEDAGLAHLSSETAYNNALADGTRKQADASMMNAYGWVLFGLRWTFIGIGLIIYGIRKPKTTPS